MILRLAHIADIHIKNNRFYNEYKQIFDNLYELLKVNKYDIIFICGDLFHSKIRLSPESVELSVDLLKNLRNLVNYYVFIILGNHDFSVSQSGRSDSISPIIGAINGEIVNGGSIDKKNVYLIKNSCTVNCLLDNGNILSVSNYSLLDKENWSKIERSNIALFHGIIENAVSDSGYRFTTESEAKLDMFNKHDLILLGDIHKLQFLSDNIAYAGSLICQNFSEHHIKGYLDWTVRLDNSTISILNKKFVPVENSKAFITVFVDSDNNITIPDNPPTNPIVRVFVQDCVISPARKKEIEILVKDILNPSQIWSVETIEKRKGSNLDSTYVYDLRYFNLENVDVQNKYLIEYFDGILDNEKLSKILDYNKRVNQNLDKESIRISGNWTVNRLEFGNFMCYDSNNCIDFDSINGIIGVVGPNRIGKTTIFSALTWGIFKSEPHNAINTGHLVNKYANDAFVKVFLSLEGKKFLIERKIQQKPGDSVGQQFSSFVNFYELDDSGFICGILNGDTKWETESNIRKIFGSFETFKLLAYSKQNDFMDMIDNLRDKEKKDVISKFLGLDIFSMLRNIAKDEYTQLEKTVKPINIENLYNNINNLKNEIIEHTKILRSIKKKEKSYRNKINYIKSEILNLQRKIVSVYINYADSDLDKINENIDRLEKCILKTIEERNKTFEKLCNAEKKLQEEKKYEKELPIMEEKYNRYKDIVQQINILNSSVCLLEERKAMLSKSAEILEKQPWCRNLGCIFIAEALNAEQEKEKTQQEINTIKNKINNLNAELKNLDEKSINYKMLTSIKDKILNAEKEVNTIRYNLEKLELNLKNYNIELDQLRKEKLFIENNIEQIKENKKLEYNISSLSKDLAAAELELSEIEKEKYSIELELGILKKNRESLIDELKRTEEINERMFIIQKYIDAFDLSGVPLRIIKGILPKINERINDLLSFVDFSIEMVLEKDDEIVIYIKDSNPPRRIEQASGMEKTLASLAIRCALSLITRLPKPSFLIIDEGFGNLDESVVNSLARFFEKLRNYYNKIFVVSHVTDVLDFCDITIQVETDGRKSHVVVE